MQCQPLVYRAPEECRAVVHVPVGQLVEPATDLAVAMAVAASYFERPVPREMVAIGEIGAAPPRALFGAPACRGVESATLPPCAARPCCCCHGALQGSSLCWLVHVCTAPGVPGRVWLLSSAVLCRRAEAFLTQVAGGAGLAVTLIGN